MKGGFNIKKILILFGVIISILFVNKVQAETFLEGEFINGEYINKVKDGRTNYLTMQFIKDQNGNIVYCLEPFKDFLKDNNYQENKDFTKYTSLSKDKIERIERLAYYGYNSPMKTDSKWYVVTQYLIWKTVDPTADIYFTDSLNGQKIDKYSREINEIESEIKRSKILPSFINDKIEVNYHDNLTIKDKNLILNEYNITSDYQMDISDYEIKINDLQYDGTITLERNYNLYNHYGSIYISDNSQNLYKPGKPHDENIKVNIHVKKGKIRLDIKDDDSVYSKEKDFGNTCYEIYNSKNELVDKVCTDKEITYETDYLPLGDYYVKQKSHGKGYKEDTQKYDVDIDKDQEVVEVELKNKLIRNTIHIYKKYCKNQVCNPEENALFQVYDKFDNLVKEIKTDKNGHANIELGYGSYYTIQISGKTGYSLIDGFADKIVDETSELIHKLTNNFIEIEQPKEQVQEAEIIPPDTSVEYGIFDAIINMLYQMLEVIKNTINV